MKRFLLSGFVLVAFVGYSIYQRGNTPVLPTVSLQTSHKNQQTSQQVISNNTPEISPSNIPSVTDTPQVANSPISTLTPTPTPTLQPTSGYKDGTFTGSVADAFYGNIQVQATIQGGKITNVQFLQYPNDRSRSVEINSQADPILAQEAIQAQSAEVDIVSGATDSSQAFVQSLQSALDNAKS